MKEAGFTPGPWDLVIDDLEHRIYGGVFPGAKRAVVEIADVWSASDDATVRTANAHLIAAAPDLYEYVASSADNGCATAKALIAKARGEKP